MITQEDRLTPEELVAIRERAERATPGPWRVVPCTIGGFPIFDVWDRLDRSLVHTEADAEFIAHAREDVPRLLAEIERLQTALEDINRAWCEDTSDRELAMKVRSILDENGVKKEVLGQ